MTFGSSCIPKKQWEKVESDCLHWKALAYNLQVSSIAFLLSLCQLIETQEKPTHYFSANHLQPYQILINHELLPKAGREQTLSFENYLCFKNIYQNLPYSLPQLHTTHS